MEMQGRKKRGKTGGGEIEREGWVCVGGRK